MSTTFAHSSNLATSSKGKLFQMILNIFSFKNLRSSLLKDEISIVFTFIHLYFSTSSITSNNIFSVSLDEIYLNKLFEPILRTQFFSIFNDFLISDI
jgi:hypothetical protein